MHYFAKILVLTSVLFAAMSVATTAKELTKETDAKKPYFHQSLPAMPKISVPKTENIVLKPYAGIDPIITGPRG